MPASLSGDGYRGARGGGSGDDGAPAAPVTTAASQQLASPAHAAARAATARRRGLTAPSSPEGLPVRRRWGRFAAGVVLALLGGWVFASLYLSAGDRAEVLALANDVGRYDTLSRDDLQTVRVASGPTLETIAADEADDLVGRVAASDLPAGTLLVPGHLFAEDELLVDPSEAVVGAELAQGDAPGGSLNPGTDVMVVLRPQQGAAETDSRGVPGWLLDVGEPDEQTHKQPVSVVVPQSSAIDVAAAAADERVALVVLEGG